MSRLATMAPHTAGIYSDMTVDGPEIGTLVVIVDRAKNLPNRKTMGKQNPYCAARLGKEAKKTETDKRGGQTPKWDQELRFTVHESPDYQNLKVSVFNDDKKTDLIGETWVDLSSVLVPGGGKNDEWNSLNYKGKYAGEIMLELTFYDTRPKVETKRRDVSMGAQDMGQQAAASVTPIKRRPLPNDPAGATPSPTVTPDVHGRAAGPRQMGSRNRDTSSAYGQGQYQPQHQQHRQEEFDYHPGYAPAPHVQSMPDYLPQLPSSSGRHRGSLPPPPRNVGPPQHNTGHVRAYSHSQSQSQSQSPGYSPSPSRNVHQHHQHPEMQHSYSEPNTHAASPQDPYRRGYEDPSSWEHGGQYRRPSYQAAVEDDTDVLPPLPPSHRSSNAHSPGQTRFIPNQSPLQSLEHRRPRGPPPRSHSVDDYAPAPPASLEPPNFRASYSGPPAQHVGQSSSPQRVPARRSMADMYNTTTPPRAHPLAQEMRRSASPNPYAMYAEAEEPYARSNPHDSVPLIKPRAVSPQPPKASRDVNSIRHPITTYAASKSPAPPPSIYGTLPRKSVSPRPSTSGGSGSGSVPFGPDSFDAFNPQSSTYAVDSNANPHSPYHIREAQHSAPSVTGSAISDNGGGSVSARPLPNPDQPITTWDGRTVDPSDHLPVHSWAPEPEKKTPTKTYGAGAFDASRPRGMTGPRTTPNSDPRRRQDFVVNVRNRGSTDPPSPNPSATSSNPSSAHGGGPIRARLVKKSPNPNNRNFASGQAWGQGQGQNQQTGQPLGEIDIPNPYAQGTTRYGDHFAGDNGAYNDGNNDDMRARRWRSASPNPSAMGSGASHIHYADQFGGAYSDRPHSSYGGGNGGYENASPAMDSHKMQRMPPQQQQEHYYQQQGQQQQLSYPNSAYADSNYGGDRGHRGRAVDYNYPTAQPPSLPPKVPINNVENWGYGASALSKEMARIDIGGSTRRGASRTTRYAG